jgi:predicted XRE-type DNA-binding protein
MVKNNNHSVFPPQEEFERVVKRASSSDKKTNFFLPPNASELDKAKYHLCKSILRYKHQHKLNTENIAQQLGLSITKMEHILFSHINKLHLDELINYANGLHLPFQVKINGFYDNQKTSPEAH